MERAIVTVLMPAYNAGKYIAEAIASVLAQTMPDFELLVINDGSADDTLDIIRAFNDDRILVVSQPNKGIAAALNTGLQYAKGNYIARFDADDVCFPQRLQQQLAFMEAYPDYVITGCDAVYISQEGEFLCHFKCAAHSDEQLKKNILQTCPFTHSGVMFRKSAVLDCGGYNAIAHHMEDHLLWVQLSKMGKFHNMQEPLIKVRFNPASVTIDERWRGKKFRDLKYQVLQSGAVTETQGNALLAIIEKQDTHTVKRGAYYALCGKKFLLNNHQPGKARIYFQNAIETSPLRLDNYMLWIASFFPSFLIRWLHQKMN